MAMDAIRAGAKVYIKTLATDIRRRDGGIDVYCMSMDKEFAIHCKVAICADGPESAMAKKLGFDTATNSHNMMSCVQFEMCNVDCYGNNDNIEFYIGNKIAKGGYAWIFPKGNGVANVGVGIAGGNTQSAYGYLIEFVKTNPATKNAQAVEVNVGGDPIGGLVDKIYGDNVVICGDAAGQVNPVEGGGLILGMLGGMAAGIVAGIVAGSAVEENDFSKEKLEGYYVEFNELSCGVVEKLPCLRDLIFSLSDDEYNKLISVANELVSNESNIGNISKAKLIKMLLKLPPRLSLKFAKVVKNLL